MKDLSAGSLLFFTQGACAFVTGFYRDKLGFKVTFPGPEPGDLYFGVVRRGGAEILFGDIGMASVLNYTRDITMGIAGWGALVYVPDPETLPKEFTSRSVVFFQPLQNTADLLRGFEIGDKDGCTLFSDAPRRPAKVCKSVSRTFALLLSLFSVFPEETGPVF